MSTKEINILRWEPGKREYTDMACLCVPKNVIFEINTSVSEVVPSPRRLTIQVTRGAITQISDLGFSIQIYLSANAEAKIFEPLKPTNDDERRQREEVSARRGSKTLVEMVSELVPEAVQC